MKILTVLVALLFSVSSLGQTCPNPVIYLNKDAAAPCSGFLFSKEKELQVRLANEENKLMKLELDNNKKMLDRLYANANEYENIINKELKKSELWRKVAEDNTAILVDMSKRQHTRDAINIGLGILITVAAGYALGQVK